MKFTWKQTLLWLSSQGLIFCNIGKFYHLKKKLALKCFLHVPVVFMPAPAGPVHVPVGIQTGWWPNAPRRTAQGRKCQRSPTATAWANTGTLGTSFSRSEKLHPKGVS